MRKLFLATACLLPLAALPLATPARSDPSANPSCSAPPASMLALGYEAFDQSEAGWRSLDSAGCERQTAEFIAVYRAQHAANLNADEIETLTWHEAQLWAASGDYDQSVSLFTRIRAGKAEPMDQVYLDATIAFLQRDLAALTEARERLATLPEPPAFARAADRFVTEYNLPRPTWPPNLDVVDRFVTCFDRPYKEAYQACEAE